MKDQSRVVFRFEETEPDVDEFRKTAEFHVPYPLPQKYEKEAEIVSSLAKNGFQDRLQTQAMSNKETSFRVSNKKVTPLRITSQAGDPFDQKERESKKSGDFSNLKPNLAMDKNSTGEKAKEMDGSTQESKSRSRMRSNMKLTPLSLKAEEKICSASSSLKSPTSDEILRLLTTGARLTSEQEFTSPPSKTESKFRSPISSANPMEKFNRPPSSQLKRDNTVVNSYPLDDKCETRCFGGNTLEKSADGPLPLKSGGCRRLQKQQINIISKLFK